MENFAEETFLLIFAHGTPKISLRHWTCSEVEILHIKSSSLDDISDDD